MGAREPVNVTPHRPDCYDAFPSVAMGPGGRVWLGWVSFRQRTDTICLRSLTCDSSGDQPLLSEVVPLKQEAGVNCPPRLLVGAAGVVVVWSGQREGRWRLFARRLDLDGNLLAHTIRGPQDAWQADCAADTSSGVWVTWVNVRSGRVHLGRLDDAGFGDETPVSGPFECQRPAVLCDSRGLTVAWDQYEDRRHCIRARRLAADEWSPVTSVSEGPGRCFSPCLGADASGTVFCCWVASEDVRDERGIIDQWHSIRCARLDGDTWVPTGDDAHGTVASLCHSLLPTDGVWGYLGRRLHPFLRTDADGRIWVLWERKVQHDAPVSEGHLLGRCLDGDAWGPTRELAKGFVFYEVERRRPEADGTLWTAMRMPSERAAWGLHLGHITLPPDDAPAVHTREWTGWTRIALPEALATAPRRPRPEVEGRSLSLFFGDLHAHTKLSADAEGEVDELYRYARDRAALDFVALVDNDCYQCPMTAADFATAKELADRYNAPGQFVALRGYEWTFWDRERCRHPNHRTVLFPRHADIFRHVDPDTLTTDDLAREVGRLGGILLTQHWDWTITNSPVEVGLEVCSAWRYYIDQPEPFHRDLAAGRRLAFVGGSDSHRRNPGTCGALTAVYARELTRPAIIEAIRARRCYATSGSRIILEFYVNGRFMGANVTTTRAPVLTVRVVGTRELERLVVVRGQCGGRTKGSAHGVRTSANGLPPQEVLVQPLSGRHAAIEWTDEGFPGGACFYYVIVKQCGEDVEYPSNLAAAEGCRAWSSPIWVTGRALL